MAANSIFLCLQFLCLAFTIIPTSAQDLGTWETLVGNAGISSMHTAVTPYNTVILLDRTDIGASELQLPDEGRGLATDSSAHSALLDLQNNAVFPLTIQTDTWCSSGQFLPDGTLLLSGGRNDGNTKFRAFTPGIKPSSYDWVELQNISLSQGRCSVEYYPPRPDGAVNFPFLGNVADNEGDNLYPYVHLLPNGNLFIYANNKYVLYDYVNNVTITDLPQLEGGPRNYPSAGSSVMLALEGDYSTAEIVICGGSQYNAYLNQTIYEPAQGTCGRIVATDPNPAWEMETMPHVLNTAEMVTLPTGDVLIINGTDPSSNLVLYQPAESEGSRFTILNPTTIPRMYHSTANLLPDGRILLAGSNKRIEAFSPDYLSANNSNLRPVVVKAPNTVQYGKLYNVYVTVPSPLTETVEVNFASTPYSTHSFSQGQRLVKLVVTSVVPNVNGQNMIVCKAPPNGLVAPPGNFREAPIAVHFVKLREKTHQILICHQDPEGLQRLPRLKEREQDRFHKTRGRGDRTEDFAKRRSRVDSEGGQGAIEVE
ncbi:hypothetical protein C3L33_20630, partial [Rhododendron williamsianum]